MDIVFQDAEGVNDFYLKIEEVRNRKSPTKSMRVAADM